VLRKPRAESRPQYNAWSNVLRPLSPLPWYSARNSVESAAPGKADRGFEYIRRTLVLVYVRRDYVRIAARFSFLFLPLGVSFHAKLVGPLMYPVGSIWWRCMLRASGLVTLRCFGRDATPSVRLARYRWRLSGCNVVECGKCVEAVIGPLAPPHHGPHA